MELFRYWAGLGQILPYEIDPSVDRIINPIWVNLGTIVLKHALVGLERDDFDRRQSRAVAFWGPESESRPRGHDDHK